MGQGKGIFFHQLSHLTNNNWVFFRVTHRSPADLERQVEVEDPAKLFEAKSMVLEVLPAIGAGESAVMLLNEGTLHAVNMEELFSVSKWQQCWDLSETIGLYHPSFVTSKVGKATHFKMVEVLGHLYKSYRRSRILENEAVVNAYYVRNSNESSIKAAKELCRLGLATSVPTSTDAVFSGFRLCPAHVDDIITCVKAVNRSVMSARRTTSDYTTMTAVDCLVHLNSKNWGTMSWEKVLGDMNKPKERQRELATHDNPRLLVHEDLQVSLWYLRALCAFVDGKVDCECIPHEARANVYKALLGITIKRRKNKKKITRVAKAKGKLKASQFAKASDKANKRQAKKPRVVAELAGKSHQWMGHNFFHKEGNADRAVNSYKVYCPYSQCVHSTQLDPCLAKRTGCTRSRSYPAGNIEKEEKVLLHLKHWLARASDFDTRADHQAWTFSKDMDKDDVLTAYAKRQRVA